METAVTLSVDRDTALDSQYEFDSLFFCRLTNVIQITQKPTTLESSGKQWKTLNLKILYFFLTSNTLVPSQHSAK
jgi:hypothetical protein